ncbi:hypothetical protein LP7551_04137 [Roseibium album]|nr:hypothetical protein LP7551_04137 [Roseibium album]
MDYSKTITIDATPDAAHQALTKDISLWWSEELAVHEGSFTIGFGETKKTFNTILPASIESGFEIAWICTAANLLHPDVGNPEEWVGTRIVWNVKLDGGTTNVTLTHVGLNETLQCHDICVRGWDHFFLDSFQAYLTTGQGNPFGPSQAA